MLKAEFVTIVSLKVTSGVLLRLLRFAFKKRFKSPVGESPPPQLTSDLL